MSTSKLADRFDPVGYPTWREKVEKDLKGASFEKRLVGKTHEGFEIQPLYHPEDATAPLRRAPRLETRGWAICPAADDATAVAEFLAADVGALWLDRALATAGNLGRLLEAVDLTKVAVYFEGGDGTTLDALLATARDQGIDPPALRGALGSDPLGAGSLAGLEALGGLAGRTVAGAPGLRAALVSTRPYHDAGASAGHELACALATGVAYLRRLTTGDRALPLEQALGQLVFSFSVGRDLFVELAKLRAARSLWARVVEACGADPAAQRSSMLLHARTAWRNKTARDPWVNMLRTTIEGFVGAVGGADLVTTAPFDEVIGRSDGFARRIARNAQVVLQEEASLGRVIDPAAGSWYVESLTRELAERAWGAFQAIEAAGGMAAALGGGPGESLVAGWIAETRQARQRAAATRREPITGVSEYPSLAEDPVRRDAASPAPAAGEGLPRWRAAAGYEALRDAAEAADARPKMLLLQLGTPRDYRARADFARSFIEAGGVATEQATATTVDEAAAAFAAADADGAVLCSSDARYPDLVPALAAALKQAGAKVVLVAGKGGEHEQPYRDAGVDGFIHVGADVVATLQTLHQQLGLAGGAR